MRITSLFEDEDDLHLFGQIALRLGLNMDKPTPLKGYNPSRLRKRLDIVAKEDWDRLVLVLDADHAPDGGPARRWKEVLGALRAAKIDIPGDASTEDGLQLIPAADDVTDSRQIA